MSVDVEDVAGSANVWSRGFCSWRHDVVLNFHIEDVDGRCKTLIEGIKIEIDLFHFCFWLRTEE
ncbi:unnamed protein product [Amoebophrya sp. A25]|nr:unnamed protein product [Amoebophrya sp. A25]|eukprot:GSA25T00001677001.1